VPSVRTTLVKVSVARVGNRRVASGTCGLVVGEREGMIQVAG